MVSHCVNDVSVRVAPVVPAVPAVLVQTGCGHPLVPLVKLLGAILEHGVCVHLPERVRNLHLDEDLLFFKLRKVQTGRLTCTTFL